MKNSSGNKQLSDKEIQKFYWKLTGSALAISALVTATLLAGDFNKESSAQENQQLISNKVDHETIPQIEAPQ